MALRRFGFTIVEFDYGRFLKLYMSEPQFLTMCPAKVSPLTVTLLDIVHGDVKCENVLIFEKDEGQPKTENHSR